MISLLIVPLQDGSGDPVQTVGQSIIAASQSLLKADIPVNRSKEDILEEIKRLQNQMATLESRTGPSSQAAKDS